MNRLQLFIARFRQIGLPVVWRKVRVDEKPFCEDNVSFPIRIIMRVIP
jgi:hypothetical protein